VQQAHFLWFPQVSHDPKDCLKEHNYSNDKLAFAEATEQLTYNEMNLSNQLKHHSTLDIITAKEIFTKFETK